MRARSAPRALTYGLTRRRHSSRRPSPGCRQGRRVPAEGMELLVMTAGALAFAVVFVQPAVRTRTMVSGAGGLVGAAAIVAAPTLDLVVFVLLALGVLHASVTGGRSFAVRLRPPLLAAALIAIALVLIRVQGPDVLDRFAAVGIGAAVAAAAGPLPYIHPFSRVGGA